MLLTQISSHLTSYRWTGKVSLCCLGVGVYKVTNAPSEILIICELCDRLLLNLKTLALTKQKYLCSVKEVLGFAHSLGVGDHLGTQPFSSG